MVRKKKRLQLTIRILISAVLFLLALEASLRILAHIYLQDQKQKNSETLLKKADITILALGESTTQMGGSTAWPYQLESILNQKSLRKTFKVFNEGRSGTTSTQILENLPHYLLEYKPDIVILMMGINDGHVGELPDIDKKFAVSVDQGEQKTSLLEYSKVYRLLRVIFMMVADKFAVISNFYAAFADEISIEEKYSRNIQTHPQDEKNYIDFSQYYINTNKKTEAEKILKKGLVNNPTSKDLFRKLYDFYIYYFPPQKGLELTQSFIQNYPNDYGLLLELANAYINVNDYENALISIESALLQDNKNITAYLSKARVYRLAKDYKGGIGALNEYIQINKKDDVAYAHLGEMLRYDKQYEAALQALQKALQINPKNQLARFEIDNTKREMGIQSEGEILGTKNSAWVDNYNKIYSILAKENIKMVAVQYPIRSVTPLKEALHNNENILLIDNEMIFKNALKKYPYDVIFIDKFAGDFGHATEKGNSILAENIATELIKKYFNEINKK